MTDPMDDLRQASADVSGVEVLSPAAQAVLDAFRTSRTGQGCLAAALRAAAEHIDGASDGLECQDILRQIADELESTS